MTVIALVLGILLSTSPLSAQSLCSQRVAVEFASALGSGLGHIVNPDLEP